LRAHLPPGVKHEQGKAIDAEISAIAPGEVKKVQLPTQAVRPGRHTIEVEAKAENGQSARAQTTVVVQEPVLALRLDGPRQAKLNSELELRLELRNPSQMPAGDVRIFQVVPEGLEFVSASTGGTYDHGRHLISWSLGSLGSFQTVSYRLRARLPGDWALPAVAQATEMAAARATHAVHLEATPTLTLELHRDPDGPIDLGAEATYRMRVCNPGEVPGQNLALVVSLPEGLGAVGGDGPSSARIQGRQIVFEPLAQLGPRQEALYRVRVRGTSPGQGRFRAQLQAAALPAPLAQEITTYVRGRPGAAPGPR
jgi:uncharacterized repeat protein (TIGR01451 family)